MTVTTTRVITLDEQTCQKCRGVFAVDRAYLTHARDNKGGYHCPYCDTHWTYNESEADRVRKELAEAERKLREAKCETMRERQFREEGERRETEVLKRESALLKKMKRVQKGVCPCCNRTVLDLQRHMQTKHPEIGPATKPVHPIHSKISAKKP